MTRLQLLEYLSDRIVSVKQAHPTRVAIDGVDAAGKTMLANELLQPLRERSRPVIRASTDSFHLPRNVRYKRGSTSPEGYYYDSFDYDAIKSRLLEPLGLNGNRQYQTATFNFRPDSTVDSPVSCAPDNAILIFDGIFLFRPKLYDYWDFKVFVDVEFEVSVERAAHRDQELLGGADAAQERYWQRYVPGQRLYIQNCHPREHADVIVKNNDFVNPTIYICKHQT